MADSPALDLDRAWRLHSHVSLRPEPFGALVYHFDTRKLSFLKDARLLRVVRELGNHTSARAACIDAGVNDTELSVFARALQTLRDSHMIVEATS